MATAAPTTIIRYRKPQKAKAKYHKRSKTIPVAALAGFVPLIGVITTSFQQGGVPLVGSNLVSNLTGYDIPTKKWNFAYMEKGTIPIVAGMLAHKIIGQKLGVNRMLARAGVPYIRL